MSRRVRMSGLMKKRLAYQKGAGWLAKKLKDQGGRCHYCGTMMIHANGDRMTLGRAPTLEHLTPLSRGGAHHWENVAVSCSRCNSSKGAMTDEEFRRSRAAPSQALANVPAGRADADQTQIDEAEHG